jgi:hypothetical protein
MDIRESFSLRDLDKVLAIAGVILSLLLTSYIVGQTGRIIYLLPGVLSLMSCLLWLVVRRHHFSLEIQIPDSRSRFTLLATCFFVLFTLSILSLNFRQNLYERPLLYFILTALMAGIIAFEVLTSERRNVFFILIQILLLGVSVAWSQLLIFPSMVGIDPWYHYAFTTHILNGSHIPDGYSYTNLPLFSLMVATTSLLTSLPYKFATMASVSLAQILCIVVFIYLLADRLFNNHRIGLLAALMAIIANYEIYMSYWSIPNSFAAIFIPITLYIFLFKVNSDSRYLYSILGFIMMGSIILTHTITAMCMSILLFMIWGTLKFFRIYSFKSVEEISLTIPLIFTIAMYSWWTYASGTLLTLGDLIKWGFSVDIFVTTPKEFLSYTANIPLNEQLFNNLGMFLFFTFSFIGILYIISRKGKSSTVVMAWVGLVPLAIGFFSLITEHSVIEDRWWYFAQILLSIPLAVGLLTIATWKSKRVLSIAAIIFLIVFSLCFLNIMSPIANVDNHIFSPSSTMTYAFTGSEMRSFSTMFNISVNVIKTDQYTAGSQIYTYPDLESFSSEVCTQEIDKLHGNTVLIRKNILGKPFIVFTSIYQLNYDLIPALDSNKFSKIYNSDSVYGYV